MTILIVLIFVTIFSLAALVLTAGGASAEAKKQAAIRLDAAMIGGLPAVEKPVNVRKVEMMSSIPALNEFLTRIDIGPRVGNLLSQASLEWTPARLLLMSAVWALIPGYLVYLRTGLVLVGLAAGALTGVVPFAYVIFKRNKRFEKFEQGLPAALDLMVSGLRSGHSLVSAMNLVAREAADPIGREFRICFDEQNYGLELRTAMQNLSKRVPIQDVRIVITAILIQKESGGNLAEVLEKCGTVIRERFRLRKEIRVRTAQGRLTGLILALLPVILGFLIFLVNPKHISLLWTRPVGLKMTYSAVGMTIIGGLIIRRIVRIRV